MSSAALLLIDLQNDYLRASGLLPAAGSIVSSAANALGFFRARGLPIAHCRTAISREDDRRMPHWKRDGRWDCVIGSEGYAPPAALAARENEPLFHKTHFSPFAEPALSEWLGRTGVRTVVLAGVHLHACVRAAALDAYQLGFDVFIVEDATGSDDPLHAAITRRYLGSRFVRFISSGDLETSLEHAVHPAGIPSVADAISAARNAQVEWRATPLADRQKLLMSIADAILHAGEDLAAEMARELGKPVTAARAEIASIPRLISSVLANAADAFERVRGTPVRFEPRGVVAAITPWNNPLAIPIGKIAPAIAFGNAALWKPSPRAVRTSHMLGRCILAADPPPALITMIEGDDRMSELLMSSAGVDAVTITGSESAGRSAQDLCGRRMLPLQAELGGNNAAVVWDDCDLEEAAIATARGAFEFAGQRCTANRRIIVSSRIADEFLEHFRKAAAGLPFGDPADPETVISPVVSAASRDRLELLVQRAREEGCGVITLREVPPDDRYAWVAPHLVIAGDHRSEIVQEESFGPLAVIQSAPDWESAIAMLNGVRQGLAAAVFTRSAERIRSFLDRADAGILKIGLSTAGADLELPFGGWKHSGIGPAEHGSSDREFYTRTQSVYGGSAGA